MFKKSIKNLLFVYVFVILFCTLSVPIQTSAKSKDTKENAYKEYEKILKNNPYEDTDGGFVAETFQLIDIDGNGIPELIINSEAPQIFTYFDGEVKYLYNSWVKYKLYTSKKTGNFMLEYSWNGETSYYIYAIKDGELKEELTITYKKKKYYEYVKDKEKKISTQTFNKRIEKYMPKKEEVKTTYKNTSSNRNKYLK